MKHYFLTIIFLFFASTLHAQWEVGVGAGVGLPITGYRQVVKSGWLLNAEGKYRFAKGNFALGMKTQFTRLQKDKRPDDVFQRARMTVAPLLIVAEYVLARDSKFQPYVTGGLGITFYSINYDTSPTEGKSIFNVSFTLLPQIGMRYAVSENLNVMIESGVVLIADGPPVGFPKGAEMTGYIPLNIGIQYRFRKST